MGAERVQLEGGVVQLEHGAGQAWVQNESGLGADWSNLSAEQVRLGCRAGPAWVRSWSGMGEEWVQLGCGGSTPVFRI